MLISGENYFIVAFSTFFSTGAFAFWFVLIVIGRQVFFAVLFFFFEWDLPKKAIFKCSHFKL